MNGAVYSEQAQCHDCYKCVRGCPVKAIRVTVGHATVMPERCIACGACVTACPSGAKVVRDDTALVVQLLENRPRVVVSLAPSFVSEFEGIEAPQLIAALRKLGFLGVSETALGAQQVSAWVARELDSTEGRIMLSTACPVAVDLVQKYHPERVPNLAPVHSPLLAHAELLRAHLGPDIAVVFVGPCIAKKLEAEAHPGLLEAVLTFEELRIWFVQEGIDPAALVPTEEDRFLLGPAAEGALYPVEGGMAEATRINMRGSNTRFMTLSGLGPIQGALRELPEPKGRNIFLELLACEGGCVCGPKASRREAVASRMQVLDYAREEPGACPRTPEAPVASLYRPNPLVETAFGEEEILPVLERIGKRGPEDELNCGACGYDSCRELARAILDGRAEGRMCVSNMRNLAQKKANALLRTLPFGVVILGQELEVIECNEEFVRLMGEDAWLVHETQPDLAGTHLEKFLSFTEYFQKVLDSGEEIIRESIPCGERTLSVTIFTVEAHRVIGALLLDVTETDRRQQQVIEKAQQVIQNMMANVQEIAFSLGRNAAKSEGILNSIIEEFAVRERSGGPDA